MVHHVLYIALVAFIFAWLLYFYGNEQCTERTQELMDGNVLLRGINDGIILGLSVTGVISWGIILFAW